MKIFIVTEGKVPDNVRPGNWTRSDAFTLTERRAQTEVARTYNGMPIAINSVSEELVFYVQPGSETEKAICAALGFEIK